MTTTAAAPPATQPTPPAAPDPREFNRTSIDFRAPMPRPKVVGAVIDWHTHLVAARHAKPWFAAADHYGIAKFVTMTPLEEALVLQREYPHRLHFIAIPRWQEMGAFWQDEWLRRIEAFHNLGSRIVKLHMAPGTMQTRKWRLDSAQIRPLIEAAVARGMIIMTHVGDPDTWYSTRYSDTQKFGTRDEHYRVWESVLGAYRDHPWVGAHLGGNPEDFARLQHLLDTFPNLYFDCSATRWMIREISARRDAARDFFIRNADRIIFGTDQVSGDERGFDFLASRIWAHRKLWETAYTGPSPISDPDLPADNQPPIRGLALPDEVLQKLYHDNAVGLLAKVGCGFPE